MKEAVIQGSFGTIRGIRGRGRRFLGIPYAHAGRFEYAKPVDHFESVLDARAFGPGCPQNRAVHEHLEHPTRRFYKKEFREGAQFLYGEESPRKYE